MKMIETVQLGVLERSLFMRVGKTPYKKPSDHLKNKCQRRTPDIKIPKLLLSNSRLDGCLVL